MRNYESWTGVDGNAMHRSYIEGYLVVWSREFLSPPNRDLLSEFKMWINGQYVGRMVEKLDRHPGRTLDLMFEEATPLTPKSDPST